MSIYATIALLAPYFEDGYTIAISNLKSYCVIYAKFMSYKICHSFRIRCSCALIVDEYCFLHFNQLSYKLYRNWYNDL